MNIQELVDILGYSRVRKNWVKNYPVDSATTHLWRAAQRAGVYGSYVYNTSPDSNRVLPPQPAVHIAQVNTEDEARLLHRRLWNLGTAPFLIVLLPHQVRVYSGFNYDANSEGEGHLREVRPVKAEIRDKLRDFFAEEIDTGRVWRNQVRNLQVERRVDRRLLKNLEALGTELTEKRLMKPELAHSLIGKYIYISYLEHRKILSKEWLSKINISFDDVTGKNASLSHLKQLSDALELRFNGEIFPLRLEDPDAPSDEIVKYVAGVFRGDDPSSGQLALDFRSYDFSFIPIEMLSSIYEQFLRVEGKDKGDGAYYTREFVADYLICEIDSVKQLRTGMRVLDPSCGSGVFLVLAYRRLIEAQIATRNNVSLSPDELREILVSSVFGVERSLDASYVTEFSLILTLLSYVDPPELHQNEDFKFPVLHNINIFNCDFFDDDSSFWKQGLRFDWIIGNPPWIKLKSTDYERQVHAWRWMNDLQNIKKRPIGKYSTCEAFSWRVIELLSTDGYVGLLIHATSLFNSYSRDYREAFFTAHEVRRVTNFANLAYVLFAGRSDAPAATLIYCQKRKDLQPQPIIHFGPFLGNQIIVRSFGEDISKSQTWILTIYEDEIKTINPSEVISGDALVWKWALWGNHRDAQVLQRFNRLFPNTLRDIADKRGWKFNQGLEICHKNTLKSDYVKELSHYKRLNVNQMSGGFFLSVPESALEVIPDDYHYVKSRAGKVGLEIAPAPHIYWTVTFAAYSDVDFVLPRPQIGIAGSRSDANHLRALSLFLNSSIGRYLLFFRCASWGIDRNTFSLTDAEKVHAPDFNDEQAGILAQAHRKLTNIRPPYGQQSFLDENDRVSVRDEMELQEQIDASVSQVLNIPEDMFIVARDFMRFKYRLIKGKSTGEVVDIVKSEQLNEYALRLRQELDDFAEIHHKIELFKYTNLILCSVEITRSRQPFLPLLEDGAVKYNTLFQSVWKKIGSQFSQWAYVQRGLRVFIGRKVYIFKSSRSLDWTTTQAMIDADDIIAEVLNTR